MHAVARDTIVVWRRSVQPDGMMRLSSYTVEPAGGVQTAEEAERGETHADSETAPPLPGERRGRFQLSAADLAKLRAKAALLRPHELHPEVATGGYAGEVYPIGCTRRAAESPVAGVNFLNDSAWGVFILQPSCKGPGADAARRVLAEMLEILEKSAVTGAS